MMIPESELAVKWRPEWEKPVPPSAWPFLLPAEIVEIEPAESSPLTVRLIVRTTCSVMRVDLGDFYSQRRHGPLIDARRIACFLSCKLTNQSLPRIGRLIGNRDHTTVMHHRRVVLSWIARRDAGESLDEREQMIIDAIDLVRTRVLGETAYRSPRGKR